MKSLTIGKRTYAGFALLCLVCAGISYFLISRFLSLREISGSIVKDSLPGLIHAAAANAGMAESQIRMNRLLRIENPEQARKMLEEVSGIAADVAHAVKQYESSVHSKEDRALFDAYIKERQEFLRVRTEYIHLVATNKSAAEALADGALRERYTAYQKAGESLLDRNSENAAANGAKLEADVKSTIRWLIAISIAGVILAFTGAFFVVRSINGVLSRVSESLTEGAHQVTSASAQVSGASQSLAAGASEQAASLEETSSSIEEMASMTQRNAENAEKASSLAKDAKSSVDAGAADMEMMNDAMAAIRTSSDDIAKIIKTIDEIAFQTNILALNAAVEAARAGEAGMGFAVVADEVRNLAQRCARSAKETSKKIEGALEKTQQGVDLSGKVGRRLGEILEKVHQVEVLIAEVASASKEQSLGISQVNLAVGQMDKVTQSNAASAEESASAAEELHAQAESMKGSVGELLALVHGDQAGASPHDAARMAATAKTVEPRGRHMTPQALTESAMNRAGISSLNGRPMAQPAVRDLKDF